MVPLRRVSIPHPLGFNWHPDWVLCWYRFIYTLDLALVDFITDPYREPTKGRGFSGFFVFWIDQRILQNGFQFRSLWDTGRPSMATVESCLSLGRSEWFSSQQNWPSHWVGEMLGKITIFGGFKDSLNFHPKLNWGRCSLLFIFVEDGLFNQLDSSFRKLSFWWDGFKIFPCKVYGIYPVWHPKKNAP